MAFPFDKQTIDLPCGKCDRKTKKNIGWIKRNKKFTCRCGTIVELDATKLNRQIKDLERKINSIFK